MDDLHMMHSFINDFWAFIKTHFTGDPKDDAFWREVVDQTDEIAKKYNNHPAVVQTMIGYLNYLDCEGSGKERKR